MRPVRTTACGLAWNNPMCRRLLSKNPQITTLRVCIFISSLKGKREKGRETQHFTVFLPDVPVPGATGGGRAHRAVCRGARPHPCPGALSPSPDPPALPSGLEGRLCASVSEDGMGEACPQLSPYTPRFPGKMPIWSPCSSPDSRAQTPSRGQRRRGKLHAVVLCKNPRTLPKGGPALQSGRRAPFPPGSPARLHMQLKRPRVARCCAKHCQALPDLLLTFF